MKRIAAIAVALVVIAPPSASGETAEPADGALALGVKRGDGVANLPGLDVSVLLHRIAILSVAGYYLPESLGRGFALAPSIQFYPIELPTRFAPFAVIGVKHQRRRFGDQFASGSGAFAAIGLDWRLPRGFSLRGGIGFHFQREVSTEDEAVVTYQPAHGGFFLDAGLRYWF